MWRSVLSRTSYSSAARPTASQAGAGAADRASGTTAAGAGGALEGSLRAKTTQNSQTKRILLALTDLSAITIVLSS